MRRSFMSSALVIRTDQTVGMAQARNGVMLLVDTNKEKTLLPLRTLPVLTPLLHLLHVALRQMVELSPI